MGWEKKLITRSVCLDVEQNQKAVIAEFKNFHEFSVNLPTSNSTNLLCWLNNNKENFTKLITQYKENLKDAQDKNEPFVEEGYLKFKLDEKIQTKEFNIFVDEIKSRLKNKNPESELIKANIVNIERKKKPKSARKKVPRGAPPYFYKIELDKLKLVFHIYETIDLNPSEKFG